MPPVPARRLHSGALGCVAFGVGTTDMANAFVTGAMRLTMPESLRIELHDPLPAGLTAKDIVLHLGLPYQLRRLPFPPRVLDRSYLDINPLDTVPAT